MRSYIVYVTAALVAAVTGAGAIVPFASAESSTTLSLVISAVQITGGVGKTSEDSIELYNPNPVPVNLNGMRLVKRSELGAADTSIKSWTTDTIVPAYSFYLWASTAYTSIGAVPDVTTSGTLSDNNGVALRVGAADAGVIVDSLAWGTANNGFISAGLANPGAGESIVRTNVFGERAYIVTAHAPRNTSVELLPEAPQAPAPILVDNAICTTETSAVEATPGQVVAANLTLTNTGTTSMSNSGVVFGSVCAETITVSTPTPAPVLPPETPPTPQSLPTTIRITELLPNPTGTDTGQEQVEFYNYGSTPVNLLEWKLDDVATGAPLSSNALVLLDLLVPAGEHVAITIPSGSFSLNNTGGDVLTLYSPSDTQVDFVTYTTEAKEGDSYALVGLDWVWTPTPSFGAINIAPVVSPEPEDEEETSPEPTPTPMPTPLVNLDGLIISEVYAAPAIKSEQEFVELYNSTDKDMSIGSGYIGVGARTVALPAVSIPAQQYFVLSSVPALANGGQTIQLLSSEKVVIDSVVYPKMVKGSSYALLEDNFVITFKPTPGIGNILQRELVTTKAKTSVSVKTLPKKNGAISVTKVKSTSKVTVKKAEGDSVKAVVSKTTTTDKSKQLADARSDENPNTKSTSDSKSSSPLNAIAVGIAVISTGVFAVYKFGIGGYF